MKSRILFSFTLYCGGQIEVFQMNNATKNLLTTDLRSVLLRTHQGVQFRGGGQLDFIKPTVGVRGGVDERGIIHGGLVDFGEFHR